jgi:predicted nucleic acid-binding protein
VVRAVVDTNVVLEGLTRLGPAGDVMNAWAQRRFQPCVSTALALEYQDVLGRKLSRGKRDRVLKALQALLVRCEYVPIRFTYRPASQDPGDDLVVDCVLNSQSLLVTNNLRDFRAPSRELGFGLHRPSEFLEMLEEESSP